MGTKVQDKSYLPGYHPMIDLNENASGSWSRCYEDNMLSGHLCNGFMSRPVNARSEYDKEMLKQTMLEHETIFRKQVYELHRLYRIQRELMDECQKKGLYTCSIPSDTSQSNSFSSQMPCKGTKKMWQMAQLPVANSSYDKAPFAAADDLRLSSNFLEEGSVQSGPTPMKKGVSLKDDELLDSKSQKFPRRMFDLQLPADVYMDCEDSERSGQNRSSLCFLTPSLCNDNFPMSSETIQRESSHGIVLPHQNKTETWFRQKPIYGIETSGSTHLSTSNNSAVTTAPSMPASFSILPQTNSSSTASSLVSSWTKPVNSTSHIPIAVQALPSFNGSATQRTHNKISDVSIQNIGNDREKWQTSRDSCQHAGIEAPYLNGSFSGFRLDFKSAPYLQLSSITFGKPNHSDIGDSSAYGNSICLETQKCFKGLHCTDVKPAKDVNLNQAFPNRIRNNLTVPHRVIFDLEQKLEESSKGKSWLRKRLDCNESVDLEKHASQMELASVHGQSQLMSSSKIVAPESEKKQDKETGLSLCSPQGFASTLQGKEVSMLRNEISDNIGNTRILGLRILDRVQQGAVSHQECSLTKNNDIEKDVGCIDLTCDVKEHSTEKTISTRSLITEKGDENISTSFRNHINLNAEVTCMDDPRLSEFSAKREVAVQSPLPVPRVSTKFASDINLEVSISQSEVNIMSHEEYMPLSKADSSQETERPHDTLVREAAENIVAMSVDVHSHLEEIMCYPLPPAQWDALFWFAEVVLSNSDNAKVLKSGGDYGSESSDVDGLDFLEAMTLKLEEIKVDGCCCQQKEFENKKEEELGAASLLLIRPRRGHARRRRQRRDFQKDILPGLASLSRHEVTEDLQTIGGLFKASGKSWQPGLTRRNTGRKGPNYQAKGRRQPRSLAATVSEIQVIPPPVHPINTDPEVDGRNMIGWGRTTRRCRRPRCAPGNVSVSASLT